ncbi:hypothetical protein [Actinacidiphila bryophytorum]|uniref:hypothetical protein n=1 Tax=Actinacidiphila bryophytorum TaxID=1436133 RepID=UPI002176E367|nr:hypothetical protein [Actinacidiphila bryophytorum]UWE08353.1 hypothetical protein NYE86_06180 [Actinacidiphila bryophytorum]
MSLAVKTVEDARADLVAERTQAAQDELGFDLNIVGPIALTAAAKAGQTTGTLRADIIQANQTVLQKLAPQCGTYMRFTANVTPGQWIGQGHCANYRGFLPSLSQVVPVPLNSTAVGIGNNSFTVTGRVDTDHETYTVPPNQDYSQAAAAAMSTTSYPIAQAALLTLQPSLALDPSGGPVALTTETVTNQWRAPIGVVGVDGPGNMYRAHLTPDTTAAGDAALTPFANFDSLHKFRSLATAVNFDGRAEVFAVDRVGQLWHRFQVVAGDDASFSPWAMFDSANLVSVSVARNFNGALQVFVSSADGKTFTRSQVVNSDTFPTPANPHPAVDNWTSWVAMADGWTSQDVAVTNPQGEIELYGIGVGGVLFQRQQRTVNAVDPTVANSWTQWQPVPNAPAHLDQIAATVDPAAGKLPFVVGINSSDQMFAVQKKSNILVSVDFSAWSRIPGTLHHVAIAGEPGTPAAIQMVGTDATGNIFRNSIPGTLTGSAPTVPTTGWARLPGELAPFGGN